MDSCPDLKTANTTRWEFVGQERPLKAHFSAKHCPRCIPVSHTGRNLMAFNVVRFLLLTDCPHGDQGDENDSTRLVSRVDLTKEGTPSDTASITSMDFTPTSLDGKNMLIGFSSGQVQAMPLPMKSSSTDFFQSIMRFNDQGNVNSSACVRAVWMDDAVGTGFIAVYEDGDILRHHKLVGNSSDSDLLQESSSSRHESTECIIHLDGCVVTTAEMSPDGTYMAVGTRSGALIVVDLRTSGRTVGGFHSFFGAITCCAWSRDGTMIAAGGEDDLISIWKVGSDRVDVRCEGHTSWISSVGFIHDDDATLQLVSVGQDCRLCIWDIDVDDDLNHDEINMVGPMCSLVVHDQPLSHVCCVDDMIIACGYDGTMKYWKKQKNDDKRAHAIQCDLRGSKREGERFKLLDLGCGDAHVPMSVFNGLDGLKIQHFTGVDASREALNLAERSICAEEVELVESELVEFLDQGDTSAANFDIVFSTFILHHFPLEEKKRLVKKIFDLMSPGGVFYYGDVYNSVPEKDGRDVVQQHWKERMHQYQGLNGQEMHDVWKHVSENDIPESLDAMQDMMMLAGFENVDVLFDDDFYACLVRGRKPRV